ncbi:MarR family winged helix-turn-helix transcriptional regulator [Shewanella zhangzhouensis]|uniref:MarR family winged helix-turn-helix transcriptional regulator n=1 Tax=Shewanella zhangzhouensis TaxID=2864213 RepID=UPI001C65FEAB|nr:MarR family transcriptional regulator [Shewanella zhangzhouensis]QYK05193.1 MarR family transcriptional regulator [Shewanella zhangzhouensis]
MDAVDKILAQWAKEKPDMDTLSMGVMGRLARLTKHLEQEIALCHKAYGLKPGEFDVLATLRRSGAPYRLTPSDLLSAMMLTSGAMTNRLDRLEAKGFIAREHCQKDRRSVEVCLTPKGISTLAQVLSRHVETQNRVLSKLSRDEQLLLSRLLKDWLAHFE